MRRSSSSDIVAAHTVLIARAGEFRGYLLAPTVSALPRFKFIRAHAVERTEINLSFTSPREMHRDYEGVCARLNLREKHIAARKTYNARENVLISFAVGRVANR